MFQKYILQKRFPSKHGAMISRYTVHVHNNKPYTKNKPQMNRNSIKFFQFHYLHKLAWDFDSLKMVFFLLQV